MQRFYFLGSLVALWSWPSRRQHQHRAVVLCCVAGKNWVGKSCVAPVRAGHTSGCHNGMEAAWAWLTQGHILARLERHVTPCDQAKHERVSKCDSRLCWLSLSQTGPVVVECQAQCRSGRAGKDKIGVHFHQKIDFHQVKNSWSLFGKFEFV